ncbi:MAG TPA: hypothetical protein VN231_02410 [Allosphingosinicella sp.]|nr:hypothetical protein [Allosphingosinicella sp.]
MSRVLLAAAAPILIVLALPAEAEARRNSDERCEQSRNSTGRSVGRGILGGLARGALGRLGGPAIIAFPVTDTLSEALVGMLDCREQQKAVEATNEAVRGGVGTTATWTSETRPGVSGSSAATGEETLADGTHCLTVTDIVIVDGQETRAPKRMCRAPGAGRYARV